MSRASILSITLALGLFFAIGRAADSLPSAAITTGGEWLQWRGPDRAGKSLDTGLLKDWTTQKPKLLWTAEALGEGYASVSLADGRIYTTGNQADGQAVVCMSAADGRIIWKKNITSNVPKHGHDGSRCTPSIDGDRLYAIASSGQIACLTAEDGREVWSRDFGKEWGGRMPNWGFSESPLVDGDWVLCTPGGPDAMMVALDKRTGKEIWRSRANIGNARRQEAGYSSIVISNACGVKQYVQLIGTGVIGVRASDGNFLWGYSRIANGTANIPTPIIEGDYVFCSTGYNTGAALLKLTKSGDEIQCEEQYFVAGDKLQNHHGQMILKDGYVYFGNKHRNGFPVCVEMESGKIAWGGDQRGAGSGSAAITYADGHLVFRYESGEVALIEATPSAYRLKGTFRPDYISRKPCWAHPVITGGRLYLRDQDKLMCYDVQQ
jgi:outer membrane protein assembly factor BamB